MAWVQLGQFALSGGSVAWSQVTGAPETATRWPTLSEIGGIQAAPATAARMFLRDDGMWANSIHNNLILLADQPAGGGRFLRIGQLANTANRLPDGNMYVDLFSANNSDPVNPQMRMIRWAGANGMGEIQHRGTGHMRFWALGAAQLHFGSGGVSRMHYDPATEMWTVPPTMGWSNLSLTIRGAAGTARRMRFATDKTARWEFGASGHAESGDNAGSDFVLNRYSDTGSYLGAPLSISRATGEMRTEGQRVLHEGISARVITGDADPGAVGAGTVWVRTSQPMGLYVRNASNNGWLRVGSMQVQKQQIFTASGTFTPPPGMIAQGGHCEVLCVGGGAGAGGFFGQIEQYGQLNENHYIYGGEGGAVVRALLSGVTEPKKVVIGAGGNTFPSQSHGGGVGSISGNPGGATYFGGDNQYAALVSARGGKNGEPAKIINSIQMGSPVMNGELFTGGQLIRPAAPPIDGWSGGGFVCSKGQIQEGFFHSVNKNSGRGGSVEAPYMVSRAAEYAGASGICIVTWWEAVG